MYHIFTSPSGFLLHVLYAFTGSGITKVAVNLTGESEIDALIGPEIFLENF